jgi:hypothetical protein
MQDIGSRQKGHNKIRGLSPRPKTMRRRNTLAAAQEYVRRGWRCLPAAVGDEQYYLKDWPELKVTLQDIPKYFTADGNIVVITGRRSRDLVDIDLDCPEAVALADLCLPATEAIFGRASKPRSHRLYIAPGIQFAVFGDPLLAGRNMLLEVRAEGQSPPSSVDLAVRLAVADLEEC